MTSTDWSINAGDLIALEREARALGIRPGRPVTSALAGSHASRYKSRGADYLESRPYQPGDDVRQLDWRVTARTGKVHTKLFTEERERPVLMLIDLAPSMYFGSRRVLKAELAAEVAALLGWAAVHSGDRIGAVLALEPDHHELAPAGGRRGVMRLIQALVRSVPEGARSLQRPAGLANALGRLQRLARPGALTPLISDFYELSEDAERRLSALRRHQDLRALWLTDPLEDLPPPPGRYAVTDGQRRAWLDARSARVRQQYHEGWETHVAGTMDGLQIPLTRLSTAEPPAQTLIRAIGNQRRGAPSFSASRR